MKLLLWLEPCCWGVGIGQQHGQTGSNKKMISDESVRMGIDRVKKTSVECGSQARLASGLVFRVRARDKRIMNFM